MIFIAGPHDPPIGHASAGVMSLPAQGRGEPPPRSRALPCEQGWPYVPVYTRNPLFAFFSFFAARFSIRLLAGFFFASFFVSIAFLITGSSDWREESAFCAKVSCLGRTSWNEPARGVHRDNLLTDHRPALGAGKAARASRSSRSFGGLLKTRSTWGGTSPSASLRRPQPVSSSTGVATDGFH